MTNFELSPTAAYTGSRLLRIDDGPDKVHYRSISRCEAEDVQQANRDLPAHLSKWPKR